MKAESVREKYAPEAYAFVRESVNYAIAHAGEVRHVSALELLENCKNYAKEQYGFLMQNVLESWHIRCADDIGEIVYELISAGKLSASPGDAREDFSVNFDLFDKNSFRVRYNADITKPIIVD